MKQSPVEHSNRATVSVSVIIPAYQCTPYIAQAIESVLKQSYSDFEIVVVNDGSADTERLEEVLAPYWDRIIYLKQPTRGPAGARNTGILHSRGTYIAFLDGDDYWYSEHLAQQVALLQQSPTFDLAYCDTILVKDEKAFARAFSLEPQSPRVTFESLLTEDCAISTSSAVVSREAIVRAGLFDESFWRCEDFDMWLRMAFMGARITFHLEAQVCRRVYDTSLSADRGSMKKDRIRVYQKMASTLPVSEKQKQIIRRMVDDTQAQCEVERFKDALEKGDFDLALEAGARTSTLRKNWKVKIALLGLRLAPRFFRRIHLSWASFMNNRKRSQRSPEST
jgi:glycosyltransferase involved in cell wall biosynthesis